MDIRKIMIITATVIAFGGLVASGTWFTYQNYTRNHTPPPTITQEQMDQTATILAEQEAKRLEEFRANLPPIKEQPKPQEAEAVPDDTYTASGSEVEVERPEFSKPEPPPPPSVPEEELKDPNSKPEVPKGPDKPTKPQGGDRRPDTDGDGYDEVYVGGFGWQSHNPGGTYESAPNAGTGDVIGY